MSKMATRQVNIDRKTPMLLPPSIQDWISEGDIAHLILDAVETIGLSHYQINHRGTGSEQYPPQMMLALLIFSYSHGITSSRRIEKSTHRDIAARFITADTHPDHDTICAFRRNNQALIAESFLKVLQLAKKVGIKNLGEVSIDGSKLLANASRHQTTTYQQLQAEQQQLEQTISDILQKAENQDQAEKATSPELPAELKSQQARLAKLQKAQAALEKQARELAEERKAERKNFDKQGPGEPPKEKPETPQAGQTVNLTDVEAPLMPQKQGGPQKPSYNVQIGVRTEAQAPLIVACDITREPNDRRQLQPMVEKALKNQVEIHTVHADSGYDNTPQIYQIEQKHGIHIYCPPQKVSNGKEKAPNKKHKPSELKTINYRQAMRANMKTTNGKQSVGKRAGSVEQVFHYIKNILGIRQFRLRGEEKAASEWVLICLSYNLRLIDRVIKRTQAA